MERRDFIKVAGTAAAGLALAGAAPQAAAWGRKDKELFGKKPKGHFTMMQISSIVDTHGNAYLIRTGGGKVVMVDGGFAQETPCVREKLREAGNHVDMWFLSHPHRDHMGAFDEIIRDPQGVTVDKVIYSRVPDAYLDLEPGSAEFARGFYRTLDSLVHGTCDVLNLHTDGQRFDIDGVGIMVLGVSNPEIRVNPYNNQSVVLRIWDDSKSVVLLGDSGVESGNKVLARYPRELDCDYMQMAHHGQNGCDEHFYKTVSFRACLWPTPTWVWDPAPQHSHLKTRETRRWMDEKGITEHHVACLEKDWVLK